MRILLLVSEFEPYRGGIGTYAKALAMSASELGHEVTVCAPDYNLSGSCSDGRLPFRVVRFRSGPPSMWNLPARFSALISILWKEKFDVVHAADWPFFLPLFCSRRMAPGSEFVVSYHGTEVLYMAAAKRMVTLRVLGFWRNWAKITCNSEYTRSLLVSLFPVVSGLDVRVVPLAVSNDWLRRGRSRLAAREVLGVPDERFVLVSLGRVVPRKGHDVVARALGLLSDVERSRVSWWIIGDILDTSFFKKIEEELSQFPEIAAFLGPLDEEEVVNRLSSADVFILPGFQDTAGKVEGFGLAYLEAAAVGLPSIAARTGGVPEVVLHGESGILVEERDAKAVASAISELLSDPAKLGRLGSCARERARQRSWRSVAAETYSISAEVCPDGSGEYDHVPS